LLTRPGFPKQTPGTDKSLRPVEQDDHAVVGAGASIAVDGVGLAESLRDEWPEAGGPSNPLDWWSLKPLVRPNTPENENQESKSKIPSTLLSSRSCRKKA